VASNKPCHKECIKVQQSASTISFCMNERSIRIRFYWVNTIERSCEL
jgi:hypothetical protein